MSLQRQIAPLRSEERRCVQKASKMSLSTCKSKFSCRASLARKARTDQMRASQARSVVGNPRQKCLWSFEHRSRDHRTFRPLEHHLLQQPRSQNRLPWASRNVQETLIFESIPLELIFTKLNSGFKILLLFVRKGVFIYIILYYILLPYLDFTSEWVITDDRNRVRPRLEIFICNNISILNILNLIMILMILQANMIRWNHSSYHRSTNQVRYRYVWV